MTAPDPHDLNTWPPEAVDRLWNAVRDAGQQTYVCPDCGTEATCADAELLTLYGSRHMARCDGRRPTTEGWEADGWGPMPGDPLRAARGIFLGLVASAVLIGFAYVAAQVVRWWLR